MVNESEDDLNDHVNNGMNNEYLMSKEENQILWSLLYMDLDHICHKIEDNLKSYDNS